MRALLHISISGTGLCCKWRKPARNPVSRKAMYQDEQVVAPTKLSQASKSIQPYVLWDRVVKLTALWDARAHCQAEFEGVQEELKQLARDTIALQQVEDPAGTVMTSLTVVCNPSDRDEVAAAVLKWTPATHVTVASYEQCFLPHCTVAIETPYGSVNLGLSLAGGTVCKVSPDWHQCQQVASAASTAIEAVRQDLTIIEVKKDHMSAAAVADVVVKCFYEQLADGTLQLDPHLVS